MATLRVYRGSTGMRQSLEQIDRLIAENSPGVQWPGRPRDAVSMLEAEEQAQARGRYLADLWMARHIVEAHLDVEFLQQSRSAAYMALYRSGAGAVEGHGWKDTRVQLRGGLKLRLRSPYMRSSPQGRGGAKRKKRGEGGAGLYPLLWALGIEALMSPASRAEVCRQSVLAGSYKEAAEQLARQGLQLDVSSIVRVAVSTGERALLLRQADLAAARSAPVPQQGPLAGKRVRISLDGGRVRTRTTLRGRGRRPGKNGRRPFRLDWIEPRILTIDIVDSEGKLERSEQPFYEVTLQRAKGVMALLVGTLRRLAVHLAAEVLFVADGALWIWRRIHAALQHAGIAPQRLSLALDYYHATEHISSALKACKNLGATEREALRQELCGLLLEPRGIERVLERLASLARGRRGRLVGQHIRYLRKRVQWMRYSLLRARKLPIGSGTVESAIRRVVNLRFKSASISWKPQHLEPLLYLRAILKAGRWEQFFPALLKGRHWLALLPSSGPSAQPIRNIA